MRATVLVLALALPGAAAAADTIRRCQADDGTMVYTDKPCAELDARPIALPEKRPEPGTGDASARPPPGSSMIGSDGALSLGIGARDDCLRRTDTLLFEIRAAIESRNVNRLAGVYDWAGKDAGAAGAILERLSRIVERPLAAVEFRYPEPGFDEDPAAIPSAAPRAERPAGVRIVQEAPGELVPSFEEDLRLVRNADCWWVSF